MKAECCRVARNKRSTKLIRILSDGYNQRKKKSYWISTRILKFLYLYSSVLAIIHLVPRY